MEAGTGAGVSDGVQHPVDRGDDFRNVRRGSTGEGQANRGFVQDEERIPPLFVFFFLPERASPSATKSSPLEGIL